MGESSNIDRRRFFRYPCTSEAEILQSGKLWGWGTVSDISRGGCYIETTHPLPTDAEAKLRVTIAGIVLEIGACVVFSDPMYGMGMDFVAVPTEQWNKLPQIIERVADSGLSPAGQWNGPRHDKAQQHHMQAALQHLEQAQTELDAAMHGKIGQLAQALQLTENAISEVKKACKRKSTLGTTDPASIGSGGGVVRCNERICSTIGLLRSAFECSGCVVVRHVKTNIPGR
jgi:PilZ domain